MQAWLELFVLSLIGTLLIVAAVRILMGCRRSAQERERRRRLAVNNSGLLGYAVITDVRDNCVVYSYSARGVSYTAGQDLSQLKSLIGDTELESFIGPATMKYEPGNPANSIVLCEEWSGLPRAKVHQGALVER